MNQRSVFIYISRHKQYHIKWWQHCMETHIFASFHSAETWNDQRKSLCIYRPVEWQSCMWQGFFHFHKLQTIKVLLFFPTGFWCHGPLNAGLSSGSVQNVDCSIWTAQSGPPFGPLLDPIWTPSRPLLEPHLEPFWTPIWTPSGPPFGPPSGPPTFSSGKYGLLI